MFAVASEEEVEFVLGNVFFDEDNCCCCCCCCCLLMFTDDFTGVDRLRFLNGLSNGVESVDAGNKLRKRLRRGVLARLLAFSGELSDPPEE